jgi:hypothetical protein
LLYSYCASDEYFTMSSKNDEPKEGCLANGTTMGGGKRPNKTNATAAGLDSSEGLDSREEDQ